MTSAFYFALFLIFILLGVAIEAVIVPAVRRRRRRVVYKFTSKDGGLHWFDHRGQPLRASWMTDQLQDYHSAQGRK